MNLSNLQLSIINSDVPRSAVKSAAASGKTTVLTEKVRFLLKNGVSPSSIAVITFTRMAAATLIDRLGKDYDGNLFVGTIHSLAAHFLSLNGRGGEIKPIAEEENFDKLFELCKNINIEHSYEWILLDEAQDCGDLELDFIFDRINPNKFFVVFDPRQSIYEFRGAHPDLLVRIMREHNATFFSLNENYRNGSSILSLARNILTRIGLYDDSVPMREISGTVKEVPVDLSKIVDYIEGTDTYQDWAILTRDNNQLKQVLKILKENDIPYNTFRQGDITKAQLDAMLKQNKVTVLTIHSAKGLEWPNVIVYGAHWWKKAEEFRINYVAATRAKNMLIWYKTK